MKKEDIWTNSIAKKLKKELDSKYDIESQGKVPYLINIKEYNKNNIITSNLRYKVDLLIQEKLDNNMYIPRLVIESKYKSATSHDFITYNEKARTHKSLFSGLRYGFMIGKGKEEQKNLTGKMINHGDEFDFIFIFQEEEPTKTEWKKFVEIVNNNLRIAEKLEKISFNKEKEKYFCMEKDIKFY